MGALIFNFPIAIITPPHIYYRSAKVEFPITISQSRSNPRIGVRFSKPPKRISYSTSQSNGGEDEQNSFQELRVPTHWLEPVKASQVIHFNLFFSIIFVCVCVCVCVFNLRFRLQCHVVIPFS